MMNGVDFRYFSFSPDKCRGLLRRSGMNLVDEHVDWGGNYYYLARKI
jgi:hypothetical protein